MPMPELDLTWLTERVAVGGGIWVLERMHAVAQQGVTHVIDMQMEFDDTYLGEKAGVRVLWNPIDDDFEPKHPKIFERGVRFAQEAMQDPAAKVFIHCAAGVHRAPMMALALLCVQGFKMEEAMRLIVERREVADFTGVYVRSVEEFLKVWRQTATGGKDGDGRR